MKKEYVVKLDVYLGVLEARVISFNQLNTGTCKLSFELTSNKQALDLTGQKVTFEVTTPGGATLEDAILVTDATQGKCECTLANDMIAEQGLHCGEINVYSADHAKTLTFKKIMYLVNGQLGAKDITVDTRYSTLQELIFDVENLKNKYVIDTEAVTQMKNETDLMHKDVIAKHGDVEVKHQEVVTLSQSVKDDASRTASNAQQVSTDKGIVTKAKNEVVAKHEEVLRTVAGIAQDKAIVEQAKTEIVGYKNEVEAMKNDVQQLVTDSTEDLILEGNRQVVRVSTEGTTQVNLAKEEVNKATQQATVATEQASLAKTEADKVSGALERLDVKNTEQDNRLTALENNPASNVTLNGEAQTNFNFIGQGVVQDGLIYNDITTSDGVNIHINSNSDCIMCTFNYFTGFPINRIEYGDVKMGFEIQTGDGFVRLWYFNKNKVQSSHFFKTTSISGEKVTFVINESDEGLYVKYNNEHVYIKDYLRSKAKPLSLRGANFIASVYNRPLTPQEIQHNLSVLNNSPSIKELHTTDVDGKTSISCFGSDEDHVEMGTGRTLREEYMGVLKTLGKEFTSTDGSPITVDNGVEARIINAEIKGQTVKNICKTKNNYVFTATDFRLTLNDKEQILIANKTYSIFTKVKSKTGTHGLFKLWTIPTTTGVNGNPTLDISKVGINKTLYTAPANDTYIGNFGLQTPSDDCSIDIEFIAIVEGDVNINDYIPFGLSSTEAIVSNNGQQYLIYHPTELNEDGSKKVILLPFAEDKVAIDETGSVTWINTYDMVTLNGKEDTWQEWSDTQNKTKNFRVLIQGIKAPTTNSDILKAMCNGFSVISRTAQYTNATNLSVSCYSTKYLSFIDTSVATLAEFKAKLQANPIVFLYQTETTNTTVIDKSIVPTILTHNKTNIWEVGGAVRASSFKIVQPVDRIAEQQAEIDEIKKQLGAVAALQLDQIN